MFVVMLGDKASHLSISIFYLFLYSVLVSVSFRRFVVGAKTQGSTLDMGINTVSRRGIMGVEASRFGAGWTLLSSASSLWSKQPQKQPLQRTNLWNYWLATCFE